MTIILETNIVRQNLFFCLRETVFMWHIAKLSNITRRIFIYEDDVDEWTQALIIRFKFQVSAVTFQFFRKKYIMNDAWKRRKSREYVQKIIWCVKFVEIKSAFNQLNVMYNDINVKLDEIFENSQTSSHSTIIYRSWTNAKTSDKISQKKTIETSKKNKICRSNKTNFYITTRRIAPDFSKLKKRFIIITDRRFIDNINFDIAIINTYQKINRNEINIFNLIFFKLFIFKFFNFFIFNQRSC